MDKPPALPGRRRPVASPLVAERRVTHDHAPAIVARRRLLAPDFHIEPHWHERAQCLFASSGVMRVGTPRRLWIVPPTRALWIPARVAHEVRMSGVVDMRSLYIDARQVEGMPGDCAVMEVTPLMRELVVRLTDGAPPGDAGEDEKSAADAAMGEGEQRLVSTLILAELRRLPSGGLDLPLPESPDLVEVCSRALGDLSIGRASGAEAGRLGVSARTFYRRFLKETGLSFARWMQQARLLEAVRRLAQGEPVTTVALDLGYQSPSAFTAMFHRALGSSPRAWRRQGGDGPPT